MPSAPSPRAIRLRDRNRKRIAARYLGPWQRLRFYAFFVASRCILCVRYALQGDAARARAIIDGAFAR
jgi:hypothetical protein